MKVLRFWRRPAESPRLITRASLEASNPDLLLEILEEGRREGAAVERERIQAILRVATWEEEREVRDAAIADPASSSSDLALRVLYARDSAETASKLTRRMLGRTPTA